MDIAIEITLDGTADELAALFSYSSNTVQSDLTTPEAYCVPIAAGGDDGKGMSPFNNSFTPYVKKMLQARLQPTDGSTQPAVAYGEPVRDWLQQNFSSQISGTLAVLSTFELRLWDKEVTTPVLCANHPSKYLYYTDESDPTHFADKKEIMTQDLIAAGWQARMAYHPSSSTHQTLEDMKRHWTDNPRILQIMRQEDLSYGYKS